MALQLWDLFSFFFLLSPITTPLHRLSPPPITAPHFNIHNPFSCLEGRSSLCPGSQ
ncbi:hypothetical protein RchiOBHm_Chr4g0436801 [Rosa chinensis]|uniref:Uncharacterized protein n=1 Tax=Rosa chinensis TaxID=74649 RepID=A0A2P6R250_ROSCH|nr:hypothetical protein RchiOBHm_Chr4g0436801 [Rosa chinensis]